MLGNKLVQCRGCRLKWIPKGGPAGACPACGGKRLGGTLELFHVGVVLVVLSGIAWVVPSMGQPLAGERPLTAAISSIVETKRPPADVERTNEAPRTHAAATPLYAVIKAKKLTARVQRGPAKGRTVTLRRGDKVTILDRKDRRYLVRDRRGNQLYVTFDKLNLRQSEKGRQYVQR